MATKKLTPREKEINEVFNGKLSASVLRYMRKNPRQVGRNFKRGASIFGSYTENVPTAVRTSIKRRSTVVTDWADLYSRSQIRTYLKK